MGNRVLRWNDLHAMWGTMTVDWPSKHDSDANPVTWGYEDTWTFSSTKDERSLSLTFSILEVKIRSDLSMLLVCVIVVVVVVVVEEEEAVHIDRGIISDQ